MNRSDGCLSPKVQLLLLGSLLTVPAKVIPAQTGPPVGTVQPPAGLAQPGAVDLVPVEEKVEEAGDAESLKITFDNVFGGTLEVESAPGEGTCIRARLPLTTDDDEGGRA